MTVCTLSPFVRNILLLIHYMKGFYITESSSDEEEAKEDFEKQALEAHNAYRKRHGVKALKFSKKVWDSRSPKRETDSLN